jgi:hypothetical protein
MDTEFSGEVYMGQTYTHGSVDHAGDSDLLALAESQGWPEVFLGPGVAVGPGEKSWRTFVAKAKPSSLEHSLATLRERPTEAEK